MPSDEQALATCAIEDLRMVLAWVRKVGMNGPRAYRPLSVPPDVGMAVMRLEAQEDCAMVRTDSGYTDEAQVIGKYAAALRNIATEASSALGWEATR